jgi:hypothetical protein
MPVMGVVKFQRFFRAAAGLHVDRNDLKRYTEVTIHLVQAVAGDQGFPVMAS